MPVDTSYICMYMSLYTQKKNSSHRLDQNDNSLDFIIISSCRTSLYVNLFVNVPIYVYPSVLTNISRITAVCIIAEHSIA